MQHYFCIVYPGLDTHVALDLSRRPIRSMITKVVYVYRRYIFFTVSHLCYHAKLIILQLFSLYDHKIVAFYVFLIMILFTWTMVLLALKYYFRIERVGCAAGGDVVDVKEMKKVHNLDKFERKHRIRRNWRVQTACLLTCITMLPCTILMIKFGLDPFIESLHDIQQINDRIDSHAYRGIQTVTQLQDAYNNIQGVPQSDFQLFDDNINNLTLDVACASNFTMFSSFLGNFSMAGNRTNQSRTPRTNETMRLSDVFDWATFQEEITNTISNVSIYDFNGTYSMLYQLTNGTSAVDTGIDTLNGHDWVIRMLVVILDVVVIFLIVGILFVKDNIDYPAYQSFTSYILLPLFCSCLIATVIGTYMFSSIAIINAGTSGQCIVLALLFLVCCPLNLFFYVLTC